MDQLKKLLTIFLWTITGTAQVQIYANKMESGITKRISWCWTFGWENCLTSDSKRIWVPCSLHGLASVIHSTNECHLGAGHSATPGNSAVNRP